MDKNKRALLKYFSYITSLTAVTCPFCKTAVAGWPGSNNSGSQSSKGNVRFPGSPVSKKEKFNPTRGKLDLIGTKGCTLSAKSASSISAPQLLPTSGSLQLDNLMLQETQVLKQLTEYKPGFAFYNDFNGPNALATDRPILGFPHGTVLFGINLLRNEQKVGIYDVSPALIMMHEWTHIVEFNTGAMGSTMKMELLSDILGGWYLGWKLRNGGRFDIMHPARSLYEKGGYDFNSRTHHGTPDQRVRAMTLGYEMSFKRGILQYRKSFNIGRKEIGI